MIEAARIILVLIACAALPLAWGWAAHALFAMLHVERWFPNRPMEAAKDPAVTTPTID